MRMRRLTALALSAVLAAGLAACGDDGEDGSDIGLEEVEGSDDETTTTTADDGDDGDVEGGLPGDIDLDDIAGLSEECRVFAEASVAFGEAFAGTADADFGNIADALDAFAASAPGEIRSDVEVVADAFRRFADEMGDIDLSDPASFADPAVAERLARAGEAMESAEFDAANENIEAYLDEHCAELNDLDL